MSSGSSNTLGRVEIKAKPHRSTSRNRLIVATMRTGSAIHLSIVGQSSERELTVLKEENNTSVHFLSPEQLEGIFRTNLKTGLTEAWAAEVLQRDGPNALSKVQGTTYWKIFNHNVFGWFQCVLWAGAILNFIAYSFATEGHSSKEYLYLGTIIVCTVTGTGLFGFYQEAKNMSVMSGFQKLVPPDATVIRDGIMKNIPVAHLVVGDIIEMKSGEIVPADVRILECTNFKTDMASLTGESIPVTHEKIYTHSNPLESRNMCYFGCPITEGWAKGIITDTGELTQIGKIAGLVTRLEKTETPLNKEITHFVKIVCGVAFFCGILFFAMVYTIQHNIMVALSYMLGIILANVPEGLLVTLTVCMTVSAKELRKKNCLAKSLQAVETLGSTSCICSDKTGTLTQNRMTVSHLLCDYQIYDHSDHSQVAHLEYSELCLAACLNLKANFAPGTDCDPIISRKVTGDASEAAILRYMEAYRGALKIRESNPKVAEIPFSSVYKYQVTIHEIKSPLSDYVHLLLMKGAPEVVIEYCSSVLTSNPNKIEMTPLIKKELKELFIKIANMGERLIGYAQLKLSATQFPKGFLFDTHKTNFPLANMEFVGAISMIDPPRPEVKSAIASCRRAGIKVSMVTGDHPATALAISRKVGTITRPTAFDYAFEHHIEISDVPVHIRNQFEAAVITGEDLRKMTSYDLKKALQKYVEITFARTSPQQKLIIVESYQALDYVVAVTGDGVNDSPALKKADIGIAMGLTGTEVSKQAADMILLDDNFASIVLGIEEGRRIFDNLKKTIAYTLTSNTPEMMPFVLYAIIGIPLPMTLMLILVINVGTDLLPAMSLAYEKSEQDIMCIPPRKLNDHLVNRMLIFMAYYQIGLIQFFAGMYSYLIIFASQGFFPASLLFVRRDWESHDTGVMDSVGRVWNYKDRKQLEKRAQTAYFVAICWSQIADLIICKTRRISIIRKGMNNHYLNMAIVVDLLSAFAVTYLPFCHEVFGTSPLEWQDFLLSLPFAVLMIFADELRRYIIRNGYSKWVEDETYY